MSNRDYHLEEEGELSDSNIREVYKQISNNMRAFIVLRFRYFATFAVIMVFVAAGAFQIEKLTNYRVHILGIGAFITVLFWMLDYRTGQYLKYYASVSIKMENFLFQAFNGKKNNFNLNEIPQPKKNLRASSVSNIIFLSIIIGWFYFIITNYCESEDLCDFNFQEFIFKNMDTNTNQVNNKNYIFSEHKKILRERTKMQNDL